MNFVNINAGAPGTGNAGRPLFLSGLTNLNTDINSFQPYGDTVYNGLQTQVRARSAKAQAGITYTLSKTTNYADNAGGNAAGAGGPRIQYMPSKELNKGLAGLRPPAQLPDLLGVGPSVRQGRALGDRAACRTRSSADGSSTASGR